MDPEFYLRIYRPAAPHAANLFTSAYLSWAAVNGFAPPVDMAGAVVAGPALTGAHETQTAAVPGELEYSARSSFAEGASTGTLVTALGLTIGTLAGVVTRLAR